MDNVPRITLVVDLTTDGVTTGILSPYPVGDGRIRIVVRVGVLEVRHLLRDREAGAAQPYHRSGKVKNLKTDTSYP